MWQCVGWMDILCPQTLLMVAQMQITCAFRIASANATAWHTRLCSFASFGFLIIKMIVCAVFVCRVMFGCGSVQVFLQLLPANKLSKTRGGDSRMVDFSRMMTNTFAKSGSGILECVADYLCGRPPRKAKGGANGSSAAMFAQAFLISLLAQCKHLLCVVNLYV